MSNCCEGYMLQVCRCDSLSITGALRSLTPVTFFSLAPLQMSDSRAPLPLVSDEFSLGGVVFACGGGHQIREAIKTYTLSWFGFTLLLVCVMQVSSRWSLTSLKVGGGGGPGGGGGGGGIGILSLFWQLPVWGVKNTGLHCLRLDETLRLLKNT